MPPDVSPSDETPTGSVAERNITTRRRVIDVTEEIAAEHHFTHFAAIAPWLANTSGEVPLKICCGHSSGMGVSDPA